MAIAGLNPHSGEHGLFGDEEVREIIPAVEELRDMGYQVEGNPQAVHERICADYGHHTAG